jgi:hypothetical protein
MKKYVAILAIVVFLAAGYGFARPQVSAQAGSPKLLEFGTMVGVPKAYTGTASPIRGITGGGLPWVVASAQGELGVNGKLEITVSGLVLDPNDPTVISRGLEGQNPFSQFKAIVSCRSVDSSGNPNIVNLVTAAFPATTGSATSGGGDAKVETSVTLPSPCLAPIVFVTSPTGAWFAVTGN